MNSFYSRTLTILCLQSCLLSINVVQLANILIIFGFELTELVLKSSAHFFQVAL